MHGIETSSHVETPPAGNATEAFTDRSPRSHTSNGVNGFKSPARPPERRSRAFQPDEGGGVQSAPRLDPEVWRRILTHFRLHHPLLNRKWFETLLPRQLSNGVIHVTCENLPQLDFLTGKCQQAFIAAAQAITNRLGMVMFHCEQIRRGGVFDDRQEHLPLSPDYTFDNFVIGPGNQMAHAASLAVAEKPGAAYNPLFIHGGVGLGKTHLLQGICQKLLEVNPSARILYLSCDSFINQFMTAVENGDMNNFRHKFRGADVLVVDDIHFFGGRERTQEEFFHTFNTLQQSGRQIILSADAPPKDIPELEDRLVSRFNWGLVTTIEKPCYETRVAIVRKKAKMRGVDLPDDVVCYIAARVDSNTRELEGAVTRIQGEAQFNGGRFDMELARKVLGEEPEGDKRIKIEHIIDAVTNYYSVKVSDLQSKRRNKSIAFPRQVCMYLARQHTRYSLEEIGGYFGGRDHTTVLHGVRTITRLLGDDPDVQKQVQAIDGKLTGG